MRLDEYIRRVYKDRDIKTELAVFIGKITDSKYIIEKGKKEGKLEIAKVLITRGQTIDSIVDITGLTIEEIEKFVDNEEE